VDHTVVVQVHQAIQQLARDALQLPRLALLGFQPLSQVSSFDIRVLDVNRHKKLGFIKEIFK